MTISPIPSSTLPPVATLTSAAPAQLQSAPKGIATAVQTLNDSGAAGSGRAFSISIDGKTKVPVVRIVDSETHELIEQIPSQYVLDLAQQIDRETASNSASGGR